jgi:hypothetical protein
MGTTNGALTKKNAASSEEKRRMACPRWSIAWVKTLAYGGKQRKDKQKRGRKDENRGI